MLLLSRATAYSYLHKFIVAEITTTIRGIAIEVPVGSREGLSKHCVVNCDNLWTIAKACLIRKLGALSPSRTQEIKRAAGYAFGWAELIDLF